MNRGKVEQLYRVYADAIDALPESEAPRTVSERAVRELEAARWTGSGPSARCLGRGEALADRTLRRARIIPAAIAALILAATGLAMVDSSARPDSFEPLARSISRGLPDDPATAFASIFTLIGETW